MNPNTLARLAASRWAPALVCALLAVALVAAVAVLPNDVFWVTDGGHRSIQLQNFDRHGFSRFDLEPPARALDPTLEFFPAAFVHFVRRGERVYSFYQPYFAWLTWPLYRAFGLAGTLLLPALSLLGLCALFPRLLDDLGLGCWRAAGTATLGFATPLLFYGLTFWEHTAACLAALGGCLLALRALGALGRPAIAFAAGLAFGAATSLREEGYVLAAAAAAAFFAASRSPRATAALAAGWASAMAPVWVFQFATSGSPLGFHWSEYQGAGGAPAVWHRLVGEAHDLAFYLLRAHPDPVLAAVNGAPIAALALVALLPRVPLALELLALGGALAACAASALLTIVDPSPVIGTVYRLGVFPNTPLLLLLLLGARRLVCAQAPAVRFVAATGLLVLALTPLPLHRIDLGVIFGPRHFLLAYPLLLAAALWVLAQRSRELAAAGAWRARRWLHRLALAAALLGLLLAGHGVRLLVIKTAGTKRLLEVVRAAPGAVVVSDVFWLPEELAALWYEKPFLHLEPRDQLERLWPRLAQHGVDQATVVLSLRYNALAAATLRDLESRATAIEVVATPGLEHLDVLVLSVPTRAWPEPVVEALSPGAAIH